MSREHDEKEPRIARRMAAQAGVGKAVFSAAGRADVDLAASQQGGGREMTDRFKKDYEALIGKITDIAQEHFVQTGKGSIEGAVLMLTCDCFAAAIMAAADARRAPVEDVLMKAQGFLVSEVREKAILMTSNSDVSKTCEKPN